MTARDDLAGTRQLVQRFNAAWNDHDLAAALALCGEDCVFEATSPPPDGARHVGHQQLRAAWAEIFADRDARFSTEEQLVVPSHVVQRWRYDWAGGHVRGIDQIDVRDGLVVAKYSYVKG